jgi:predicted amidophosphoribosyltransferase
MTSVTTETPSPSWHAHLRAGARRFLDLGLPPLCPTCRAPVADQGGLCAQCWSKVSFIARPYCEHLGIPFVYDPGPGILSMEAIADPPAYHRARAAVRYDEAARTMVQAFKYGDRLDLAPAMGHWMALAGRELLAEADALIPVPLHWRRLWSRRFNPRKSDRAAERRSSRLSRSQARTGDPSAGWIDPGRARNQCPGRFSCTRRGPRQCPRETPPADR